MKPFSDATLWLAYVPYPVTTAVYLEKVLRTRLRTVKIGPEFPAELVEEWHLQDLRRPFLPPDMLTSFTPDMGEIIRNTAPADMPSLYLWVESVGGYFPENLDALPCTKACYLIDSHLNLAWHLKWAEKFDHAFIAQREYLQQFRDRGMNAHWLPLGCDPEVHAPIPVEKTHDICFVGSLSHNPRRQKLLETLDRELGIYCRRCWWDEMARVYAESRIVFNNAVKNDLNMRVFEALSVGSLLLTDPARGSGQETLFRDGEELAVYRGDDELLDVVRFYLDNEAIREQVSARGRQVVHNAHTYGHRIDDLLAVAIGGKEDTLSAEELRELSVSGLADPFTVASDAVITVDGNSRSFVIPVLDYSPASEYSIATLLGDLEQVSGDVVVVFNDQGVAEELRRHPRITHHAIMKHNVGVARAWNIGIDIAVTPHVFIVNADVHVEPAAVDVIETGLAKLDRAASAGPQGSYFDFRLCRDYLYFDKGTFDQAMEVDAVSGFLFAVKRELFEAKLLRFEDAFTPCYFEEWDLGLQIKKAGFKSYIVPTSAYDHHWSGTIAARKEIAYYDRSETPQAILRRNRQLFQAKWRSLVSREGCRDILDSGIIRYAPQRVKELLKTGNLSEAEHTALQLATCLPDSPQIQALAGYVLCKGDRPVDARQYFKAADQIDGSFDTERFLAFLAEQS